MEKMEKMVITAAITGGASPASNPHLPKNAKLQIQAAVDAYNAGASVVHIHARNPDTGEAEHRAEYFAEAIAGIRDRTDLIVNVTTGGSGRRVDGDWLYREVATESVKGRVAVLPTLCEDPRTKPDIASFNAGSPVIDIYSASKQEFLLKFVMVQSFPDMQFMARVMKDLGVKPELECYDVGMVNNALFLRQIGELEDPLYFQLVLGVLGQIPANLDNLLHLRRCIPEGLPWSVCAVGLDEWPMVTAAMILGGNIRVGFEDNIYLSRGRVAKSNAEMVEKAVRIARELDREVADVAEARRQLGLAPRP